MSVWPTHPNGENKRVGDMTPEERAAVMKDARDRFMSGKQWLDDDDEAEPPVAPTDFTIF